MKNSFKLSTGYAIVIATHAGCSKEVLLDFDDFTQLTVVLVGKSLSIEQNGSSFRVCFTLAGKKYILARYLLSAVTGTYVVSKNNNPLDCRRDNLLCLSHKAHLNWLQTNKTLAREALVKFDGPTVIIPVLYKQAQHFVLVDKDDWHWLRHHAISVAPHGRTFRAFIRDANSISWYLHRAILQPPDDLVVDHKNGNGLDCRRANLEVCLQSENMQNILSINSATGERNVYSTKDGRYMVSVTLAGRKHYLGYFSLVETAAAAASEFRELNLPFSKEARQACQS